MSDPAKSDGEKKPSLGGGLWTVALRVVAQLLQFSIFIVAVRVLSPAEFGVFALVAATTVVLNQFAAVGWPEYIMQWTGGVRRPRQTLFIAMTSGAFFMMIGFCLNFLAPLVTNEPDIHGLIQIFSIWIFFSATGSALAGMMNWQNKLTAAAFAALGGDIANVVVAIWALLEGYGVFALAFGRLAGAIVWTLIGFSVVRMTPCPRIRLVTFRNILKFSSTILTTRLLISARIYAGAFLIGGFMGPASVGYYRAAQRIVGAFGEIVSEPTRVLAWALFRKARKETGGTTAKFPELGREFFGVFLICTVPLFAGVALLARDLTYGVLGAEWAPAVPVVRALAIANMIAASSYALEPILSLARYVKIMPWIVALYASLNIVFIWLAAPYGIHAVAGAEVLSAASIFAANIWFMWRFAGIRWDQIALRARTLLPVLLLSVLPPVVADYFNLLREIAPLLRFVILSLSMVAIFIPSVLLFDRGIRLHVAGLVGRNATP